MSKKSSPLYHPPSLDTSLGSDQGHSFFCALCVPFTSTLFTSLHLTSHSACMLHAIPLCYFRIFHSIPQIIHFILSEIDRELCTTSHYRYPVRRQDPPRPHWQTHPYINHSAPFSLSPFLPYSSLFRDSGAPEIKNTKYATNIKS